MERNRTRDRDEDRGSSRGRDRDDSRSSSSRGRDDDRGGRSSRDDDRYSRSSRSSRDDDRGSSRGRSSGRSSGFEYQARSREDVTKRSSMGSNDYDKLLVDGIKMWKPQDGDNSIRFLPATWKGAKHYGLDIHVHYGVGPDRQAYLDLKKMKGEDDPISEEREMAVRDGDEKYAKELESKRRVLVYLVDRNNEKEGVQAWAMPWTVDRDIVKVCVDKKTGEVLPIDHPEEGYDVEFEKKGQKDRTEYLGVSIARRSSELGDDRWLDYAIDNPLPEQLQYFDYDHIAKAFGGGGSHKNKRDRDEDDERDAPRRGSSSSRGRDRDEDEDPPRRSSSRSSSRKDDDEPTWESIHEMSAAELDDLIELHDLDIDPKKADGDEDLADWICEELKLKPEEKKSERRRVDSKKDEEESPSDRLRRMREERR